MDQFDLEPPVQDIEKHHKLTLTDLNYNYLKEYGEASTYELTSGPFRPGGPMPPVAPGAP